MLQCFAHRYSNILILRPPLKDIHLKWILWYVDVLLYDAVDVVRLCPCEDIAAEWYKLL